NLLAKKVYSEPEASAHTEDDRIDDIKRLLHGYQRQIDGLASTTAAAEREQVTATSEVIVLTGSTGTVGSFLLDHLMESPAVSHIYCLNRAQDSRASQTARNKIKKLSHVLPQEKVTFLKTDLTKELLGLDTAVYKILAERTTQIIHTAWPVNFNHPLSYFAPSLTGVLNLLKLAHTAQQNPTLLFLSSISAVSAYHSLPAASTAPCSPVPEEIITDPACTAAMGYGESKYLAERILDYACDRLRVTCGIARIGQVCGTAADPRAWNKAEWLPSLIVSSRYLETLPASLGGGQYDQIDWIPVDLLAPVLTELSSALSVAAGSLRAVRVFHCVNPHRVAWQALAPVVVKELARSRHVGNGDGGPAIVPLSEWVQKLHTAVDSQGPHVDFDTNPAAKLVEFYEQLLAVSALDGVRLSTAGTLQVSKALSALHAVRPEWLQGWIREWLD
ncbi:male sterility protein-domain-containing protein, partial [Aspergillus oleicola]